MLISWVAMILGGAAFTPAVLLCLLSGSASIWVGLLGSWRLAILGIWFCLGAWLANPISQFTLVRAEGLMAAFTFLGLVLSFGLAVNYRNQATQQ